MKVENYNSRMIIQDLKTDILHKSGSKTVEQIFSKFGSDLKEKIIDITCYEELKHMSPAYLEKDHWSPLLDFTKIEM